MKSTFKCTVVGGRERTCGACAASGGGCRSEYGSCHASPKTHTISAPNLRIATKFALDFIGEDYKSITVEAVTS